MEGEDQFSEYRIHHGLVRRNNKQDGNALGDVIVADAVTFLCSCGLSVVVRVYGLNHAYSQIHPQQLYCN